MIERNAKRKLVNIQIVITVLFLLLVSLSFIGSEWLAKNVFCYDDVREFYIRETYTEQTGEKIETFVCYTTQYGECYHSAECGSLWNSSYETTVYEAVKNGYIPCSKCEPTEKTEFIVTEEKQKLTKSSERIEKYPVVEVIVISVFSLLVIYIIVILYIERKKERK